MGCKLFVWCNLGRRYLKQYDICSDRKSSEHDIVDGADNRCVEQVQSLVQVVHLCDHTCRYDLHALALSNFALMTETQANGQQEMEFRRLTTTQ